MNAMNRRILHGDILDKLKEISSESFDCIISSPPYWGLRDYGVKGQLGLEPDFRDYLKIMSRIMTELKRVLKNTGTCWINLGDTYAGGIAHSDWSGSDEKFDKKRQKSGQFDSITKKHLTAKSRYGIPERFYINCIDNGWIARNHIPWYKANSMPSSVKDRFTNKWESVFFFAKNQKYYFNLDAVREKTITETKPFNVRVRDSGTDRFLQKALDDEKENHNSKGEKYDVSPQSNVSRLHRGRKNSPHKRDEKYLENDTSKYDGDSNGNRLGKFRNKKRKQDQTLGLDGKPIPMYEGFNERWATGSGWDVAGDCLGCGQPKSKHKSGHDKNIHNGNTAEYTPCNTKGKNPGDVFFINPRPFPEAHFATFPVDLPLRILKCACPSDGIVLDPFFGSGTVGIAAEMLGLQWCGIELKEEYIKIAKKRLEPYLNNKLEVFR